MPCPFYFAIRGFTTYDFFGSDKFSLFHFHFLRSFPEKSLRVSWDWWIVTQYTFLYFTFSPSFFYDIFLWKKGAIVSFNCCFPLEFPGISHVRTLKLILHIILHSEDCKVVVKDPCAYNSRKVQKRDWRGHIDILVLL